MTRHDGEIGNVHDQAAAKPAGPLPGECRMNLTDALSSLAEKLS
jgi:hypothetical protein